MILIDAQPSNSDTKEDGTTITHASSDPIEDLSKAAFSASTEQGIGKLIEDLQEAFKEEDPEKMKRKVDAIIQGSEKRVLEQSQLAAAAAEASLDLADLLSGKTLTPETEKLWLRLLEGLTPGPYAQYMLNRLATIDIRGSSVLSHLSQLHTQWSRDYGKNILYAGDLEQLGDTFNDKKPSGVKALFQTLW